MDTVVDRLRSWDDSAVRYQARLMLDGVEPDTSEMRTRADETQAGRSLRATL